MGTQQTIDVVVVGGGLGGLTAAALLAKGGARVTLLEKSSELGGRGGTTEIAGGFRMNLGPHALYRGSAGIGVLGELGITPKGKVPTSSGLYAMDRGVLRTLPVGFVSMMTTGLLPLGAKLELGRLLTRLPKLDAATLDGITLRAWIDSVLKRPEARAFLEALVRVSTYANAPDQLSAGAAIDQVQRGLKDNVLYLDGGWSQLVSALRDAATAAGVELRTGVRVTELARGADGRVTGVRLANGEAIAAAHVIVAATPAVAAGLAGQGSSVARHAAEVVPVRAACLDLALSSLPKPRAKFALGIDAPTYLSVHSLTAELAPAGGALIHVAKYLAPGDDGDGAQEELEAMMDAMQPGWREVVVHRRYLPKITVASALDLASAGGLKGRQPVLVADVPGLSLVGDWVGGEGMLADASFASAREAARGILAALGRTERAAA